MISKLICGSEFHLFHPNLKKGYFEKREKHIFVIFEKKQNLKKFCHKNRPLMAKNGIFLHLLIAH